MRYIKSAFISISFVCAAFGASGQTFTSVTNGMWDNPLTWGAASAPSASNSTSIIIAAGTEVTLQDTRSIDQTVVNGDLIITTSGVATINNGTGTDLILNATGTMEVNGTGILILSDNSTLSGTDGSNTSFYDNSVFRLLYTASEGELPLAFWNQSSTVEINGYTTAKTLASPSWEQAFGNVSYNCAAQIGTISFAGLLTGIEGNFTISNTNGRILRLSTDEEPGIEILGNLNISGNSRVDFSTSGTATEINISGDFNYTSPNATGLNLNTTGSCTVNVFGDFNMNAAGGRIRMASGGAGGVGIFNFYGDFARINGDLGENGGGVAEGNLNFIGSGLQTFVNDGNTAGDRIANRLNYYVGPDCILDLDTYAIDAQTANTNTIIDGTLLVGSLNAAGAIANSTSQGNVQTTVALRQYNPGSVIIYDGAGAQFIGLGHPSAAGINAIVENILGVTTAANTTIGGDLVLQTGNLNVSTGNILTLNGNLSANSNTISVTSTSDIVINGSGSLGVFPFPVGPIAFRDFILNRTGGDVVFANNVTLSRAVSLIAGDLIINSQILSMNGTFASSGGGISANNASTIIIGGSGSFGTLNFSPPGNVLNTLTINRTTSGTVSLDNNLFITSALNLSNGNFINNSGLELADGATITRNSAAQLTGLAITTVTGEFYNLTYTGGALTTGLELPTVVADNLFDLNISGGPVTLSQSIIANNNVTLTSSTLNAGANFITLAGSAGNWNRNGGVFNAGTGTVTFTGNIIIGGANTTQFNNLTTETNSGLTISATQANVSGNFQLDANSTFNAGSSAVLLNGSGNQSVSGGGKTFNNITVSKTGGSADFFSETLVAGIVRVTTATTVNSNGNLALLSTSDGSTGTAMVARLPTGASIAGDVIVQRFMSSEGRIYRYLSSPITNARIDSLQNDFPITGSFIGTSSCSGCTANGSMFFYDETQTGGLGAGYMEFPAVDNTEQMQIGRGYSAFVRQNTLPGPVTIKLTGNLNQGSIPLPVTFTNTGDATSDGWNLVGNPFACTIDWDIVAGWAKTRISPTIAIRDNGAGGVYQYWDGDGNPNGIANGQISTGQGFWVRTVAGAGSPSLIVDEDAKVTTGASFFRENSTNEVNDVLVLSLEESGVVDNTFVKVKENALNGLDDLDAPKLDNELFDLGTVSVDNVTMAINALQNITCSSRINLSTKQLNYTTTKSTFSYTLRIAHQGWFSGKVYQLFDKFLNKTVLLSESLPYSFTVSRATGQSGSYSTDRFFLTVTGAQPNTALEVAAPQTICLGNEDSKVVIKNSEEGLRYYLTNSVIGISDTLQSAGGDIELSMLTSELQPGNEVITVWVDNGCQTLPFGELLSLDVEELPISPTMAGNTVCKEGSMLLEVSNPSPTFIYNWYKNDDESQPIQSSNSSSFNTPTLTQSTSYFVSSLSTAGCESPKVPVSATVINYVPVFISNFGDSLVSSYAEGNQWYLDAVAIPNATDKIYVAKFAGGYSVKVGTEFCSTTANYVINIVTDSEEKPFEYAILEAYPNPLHGEIINVKINSDKLCRFTINDIQGNQIQKLEFKPVYGQTIIITMSKNEPGIYVLQGFDGQRYHTLKIVKK